MQLFREMKSMNMVPDAAAYAALIQAARRSNQPNLVGI
jgi:hypothetical protein